MDKIKVLMDILKEINNGQSIESIKEEAKDLLEMIDPTELSLAEQKLIEEGVKPEDLRGLCVVHMEMLEGNLEKLKASVDVDHPLYMLIEEHNSMLTFLEELDRLNVNIQNKAKSSITKEDIDKVKALSEKLLSAENHHLREEDALFPELEKRGITGPTRIMRLEHDDLRAAKKKLLGLSINFSNLDMDGFKKDLDETAKFLVFNLRDHIFKENHILYPSALDSIKDDDEWRSIKKKCDNIGYCPFSKNV